MSTTDSAAAISHGQRFTNRQGVSLARVNRNRVHLDKSPKRNVVVFDGDNPPSPMNTNVLLCASINAEKHHGLRVEFTISTHDGVSYLRAVAVGDGDRVVLPVTAAGRHGLIMSSDPAYTKMLAAQIVSEALTLLGQRADGVVNTTTLDMLARRFNS